MSNFFYCNSYQSLYIVLDLFQKGENVVLMSSKRDILKTCDEIGIKSYELTFFSDNEFLDNSKKIKKYLKKVIELINGCKLHFTHTQFDLFCFLLVSEYSKESKPIEFYDIELVLDPMKLKFSRNYIYALYKKLRLQINYKLPIEIRNLWGKAVLSISNDFLKSDSIHQNCIKTNYYEMIVSTVKEIKLNYGNSSIMFLGQNYSRSKQLNQNTLLKLYSFLENLEMDVKHHPYMQEEDIFENHYSLPTYLPSELLYTSKKIVISINSVGLITAAFMEGVKSISLMNLVTIIDPDTRDKIKKYLIKESKGKILFPESYKELNELIE